MSPEFLGEAIVGGLVILKQVSDVLGGRARDKRNHHAFGALRDDVKDTMHEIQTDVKLIRNDLGASNSDGVRGDLSKVERRVDALEDRERTRVQNPNAIYDRRGANL